MSKHPMLGYSVGGYGELSFVPDEIVKEADRQAEALMAQRGKR
jgi:hypothetical protein